MSEAREERRLAAIVIGDVVGYSRLMGVDESGTMRALKARRNEIVTPLLAIYRARLVNSTGDAMLLEFGSAVDAVACAVAIQRAMIARNVDIAPDRQIAFRLGINLGDIVIDGHDIYGDGVNVAARLETLCDPGGICVSRAIEEQVRDKLPYPLDDRGEHSLKNIARPVRVFSLTTDFIATLPEPPLQAGRQRAPTTQLQVRPGTRLNDAFQIDSLIGSGGMGEIFRGHEIHTGDAVAIKLIRLDMVGNEAALALFQKEASVLKHIYNEAIVRYYVFSFDQAVGRHYLAMEFVDGQSLSDLLRNGALPFEAAEALRRRVASALQVAHERGIVHRDVSPDNIIIPAGDISRAKIIDFGIARSTGLGGDTVIGDTFAGKYGYVSPEQLGLEGGDITPRSDIYSFGLVLAEALSGQAIDMGRSQAETIEKRRGVPDLARVDARIRPLLERMLQPDPSLRPPSMAAVAQWSPSDVLLETRAAPRLVARSARSSTTSPRVKRRMERWIIGGAVLAALLWGAGLTAFHFIAEPNRKPTRPDLPGSHDQKKIDPPPPNDTATAVAGFVADYDGGACFFAQVTNVSGKTAGIDGFAQSAAIFDAFDQTFTKTLGFEPDITGQKIWSRQCPALVFLKSVQAKGGRGPDLFLKSTALKAGQALAGEVHRQDGRPVELLQVREDGSVVDLSGALKGDGDVLDFELPLTSAGAGGPFPQVIIAVTGASTSAERPVADVLPADQLFPELAQQTGSSGQPIGAKAKLVLVGG